MVESQPTYEFGPFRANAHTKRLWRDGEPVPLAPKVLETLLVLIAFRDRVVSKDELLERVWDGAAVEEGGLTRNISVLRKTLGETPDEHTYIVTVPGKGYRFVAEVRQSEGPGSPASEPVLERQAAPAGGERWLRPGSCSSDVRRCSRESSCIGSVPHHPSKPDDRRLQRWLSCRWTICPATPRRNTSQTA